MTHDLQRNKNLWQQLSHLKPRRPEEAAQEISRAESKNCQPSILHE